MVKIIDPHIGSPRQIWRERNLQCGDAEWESCTGYVLHRGSPFVGHVLEVPLRKNLFRGDHILFTKAES